MAVSAITFSELWFGIDADENAARSRRRRRWLEKTFRRLEIIPLVCIRDSLKYHLRRLRMH